MVLVTWLLTPILFSIFMRRRPLARAAVVGGAAYYGGKKRAEGQARDQEQEARIQDLEAQQYEQQAAPAAAAPAKDPMEQLKELAALHEQGVLTDAEFEIQKTKILQGM
jgi:Short C-terminal domain